MFLIRLMHLSSIKLKKNIDQELKDEKVDDNTDHKEQEFENNSRSVESNKEYCSRRKT